jgi:Bacterial alpha-L-rhamnosidase 6 hairpin glycosidase domain
MKNWIIGSCLFALAAVAQTMAASLDNSVRITTKYIDAKISLDYPGFEGLSVDSLGKEHFPLVFIPPPPMPEPARATVRGPRIEYRRSSANDSSPARWIIEVRNDEIRLESHWSAGDPPEPFVLNADADDCHVTLLGLLETNGSIQLPAIMHFPDQGTFQISAPHSAAGSLDYSATRRNVEITFPPATREHSRLTYRLKVTAIHPKISGIDSDARFDGFRRDWLNIFQINPQRRLLSNNSGSDSCGYCYYEYADIAEDTPPLAGRFTALDMVRQTLDRIIAGALVCGMPGYAGFYDHPADTADTLPSFLIAAEDYVAGSHDQQWLAVNYRHLESWADGMLATDTNHDGLIKYPVSGNSNTWPDGRPPLRPSNWWDTIGFGYEDAYANALAYRALTGMEQISKQAGRPEDEARYRAAAEKLKAVYFKTFYDPATGVLAGWRSADGQLHDYYFLWLNGIAIHYGLVPTDKANDIMDRLLTKMREVGYTNFALGLPGNLIPVARKDYAHHEVRYGGGTNEDGSDGFQIYENGGATACFAYFTLAALYDLGRIQDGDRILFPMLDAFAKGDYQGFGSNHMSKDWKTWNGEPHGYEGLLNDNYYTLLAVMDREKAIREVRR